jgi:hypothetical protein
MINVVNGKKAINYIKKANGAVANGNSLKKTIQSGIKGENLSPLQKDSVNLTQKPNKFNSQGERLKAYYESKGVPYLLPHQEWSDKKILDTIDLLDKDITKMIKSKTINKQTLQESIEKLAPETKGKIIVKDFSDLKKDYKALGYSDSMIKHYLQCNAAACSTTENSAIYLKFESITSNPYGHLHFRSIAEHEVKHALSARLQNTMSTNIYKNNFYKSTNQQGTFNNIFNLFENNYSRSIDLMKEETTKKNMLDGLGFNSINELHNDFESKLGKLIREKKATGKLHLGNEKRSWKQFFDYLKNMAKDEKEAYSANKSFRECFNRSQTSTNSELVPLKYEEMEKFFAQKRVQVNKEIPKF